MTVLQSRTAWKVPVFGVFLVRIQSECWKMRTRKTPNTDIFHAISYYQVFMAECRGTSRDLFNIYLSRQLFSMKKRHHRYLIWYLIHLWNSLLAGIHGKYIQKKVIHNFTDSVLVCKIHGCYKDTQNFWATFKGPRDASDYSVWIWTNNLKAF